MTFKPELPMITDGNALESTFMIDVGDHEKVSEGTVSVAADPSGLRLRWQSKSPEGKVARVHIHDQDRCGWLLISSAITGFDSDAEPFKVQ